MMSSAQMSGRTLSNSQRATIKANASKLRALPDPDETWTIHDLDDAVRKRFKTLEERNLIESVDTIKKNNGHYKLWRTRRATWSYLKQHTSAGSDNTLPACDHVGFTNLPDSPLYECNTCGTLYKKSDNPNQRFELVEPSFDAPTSPDQPADATAD